MSPMKRTVPLMIVAALGLAAGYVALSPAYGIAHDLWYSMVFKPKQYCRDYASVKEICGVEPQNIYFPSLDGKILHGWYFDARQGAVKSSGLVVLVNHGNSGNVAARTSVTKASLKTGASVFLYDYQGFGKSQGQPSLPAIVEDGLSAFDYVKDKLGYKSDQIVLYGESLGTGVTCEVANQRQCSGVILQSGFMGLPEIAREKVAILQAYPDMMFPTPFLRNAELVKHINCPVLVFHGKLDALIPIRHAETVYQNVANKYKLVEIDDAHHGDLYRVNPTKMYSTIAAFLGTITGTI